MDMEQGGVEFAAGRMTASREGGGGASTVALRRLAGSAHAKGRALD
jgi:hypothetical protein